MVNGYHQTQLAFTCSMFVDFEQVNAVSGCLRWNLVTVHQNLPEGANVFLHSIVKWYWIKIKKRYKQAQIIFALQINWQVSISCGTLVVDTLTHFTPMLHFYTPWKRQISGVMETEDWRNLIEILVFIN